MKRHSARIEDKDNSWVVHVCEGISTHLDEARKAAKVAGKAAGPDNEYESWRRRFLAFCSGSLIERAYRRLHAAKTMLAWLWPPEELDAHVDEALARLQECLASGDPRLARAEAKLLAAKNVTDGLAHPQPRLDQLDRGDLRLAWADAEAGALQQVILKARNHTLEINLAERQTELNIDARRAWLRSTMRLGYDTQDERHSRLRNFRNIVGGATLVLTLLTIAISILGSVEPDAIPLCFHPENQPVACPTGKHNPTSGDVALVATLGLLGGALSAALAMRGLSGKSTPYQAPVALSLFKLPSGALTSVVGLLLLAGDFVPGFSALDSQEQILAYAVVFGFAQQLATRLVDRQAREVLGRIPSKEESPPGGTAVPSGASSAAPMTGDSD